MRRKFGPHPIERSSTPRPLVASGIARAALPTAAALALALAGVACSGVDTEQAIRADKVVTRKIVETPAPSASVSTAPAIDPDPMPLPGEMMIVTPPPVPSAVPSSKPHKLGGKPAPVHTTI